MLALIDLVRLAGTVLTVLILARVILSWINPFPSANKINEFVWRTTEPLLGPVRSILPPMGGIDFSPILVLVAIQIVERLLIRLLFGLASGGM